MAIKKRPAHLSIVERLGGFWCCKGKTFIWIVQGFWKKSVEMEVIFNSCWVLEIQNEVSTNQIGSSTNHIGRFGGLDVISGIIGSSRAREFHPHPLTEPCVKVSPHTALHSQRFVHRHNLGADLSANDRIDCGLCSLSLAAN